MCTRRHARRSSRSQSAQLSRLHTCLPTMHPNTRPCHGAGSLLAKESCKEARLCGLHLLRTILCCPLCSLGRCLDFALAQGALCLTLRERLRLLDSARLDPKQVKGGRSSFGGRSFGGRSFGGRSFGGRSFGGRRRLSELRAVLQDCVRYIDGRHDLLKRT